MMRAGSGLPTPAHSRPASHGRQRIAIVTGFTLARNPRPLKEAMALQAAGYEVVVLGAAPDRARLEIDQALARRHGFDFQSVVPLGPSGRPRPYRSLGWRLRTGWARKMYAVTGWQTRFQLGNFVPELLQGAVAAQASYHIVHLEQALWVGCQLLRTGRRVGIDMEDWYSEDLLPEARRHRPLRLLRGLEGELLRDGAHRSCPSRAMGEALEREFGCPRPAVVYNTFPWADRHELDGRRIDRHRQDIPSLHWFSQTIGPGRGLEDLFRALPLVTANVEIHLRGDLRPADSAWLHALIPEAWRHRVFTHPLVSNEELLSRIAEHDIGFAAEMKYCRSRDLTVTNKLFHYFLGGLAVLASDTAGQREIAAAAPGAMLVYPAGNAPALAAALHPLLDSPATLARTRAAALRAAQTTFCWEKSSVQLLAALQPALRHAGR